MKVPAKIFVNYVKDEGLPTIGVFRTERINEEPYIEFIRRDVVEKMLKRANQSIELPIDNVIFNEAIDNADND